MNAKQKSVPYFIGIGGQRCGTSWTYACLFEHPEICAPEKEIHFFSRDQKFSQGYDWYESFFKNCGAKKAGEFSTSYISDPRVAERIAARYPEIKIIAILRNPVDRAVSNYFNDLASGKVEKSISFDEALQNHPEYIDQGLYGKHLEPFFKAFSKKQILILRYEDSLTNPEEFIRSIYQFLEVDSSFKPSYLKKKVNVSRVPTFVGLDNAFLKISSFLRKSGLTSLWWLIKKSGLPRLILRANTSEQRGETESLRLKKETKEYLQSIFASDKQKLTSLTGINFPNW